jgi:hypothetical protein
MDQDNHMTRDRKSFFSHISASHAICWHHTGAIRYFGHAHPPIISAPRADYTTTYNETLAYNQGIERKYLPTHHSTSRRIAGPAIKATPMSWLPYIVTYVTPPSTAVHVSLSLFTSKHYHIYRANCLAVVGVITGVRIERHKLQSQHWRRDVV